ncbi:GNAT family N-acetyltransferase [Acetobacter senegalensis]|uniref:GNAT family N-acetyltransferase n=1 Tax=Acetobacter senegalensis TaxID=446692 RepID=UPI0026509A47|nr:GNAT family N-acetyltransferase [Acetobacter senegalensis]MDN7355412.1 GNAT family N-acetyltransferase [Acetobacter senegalensis]
MTQSTSSSSVLQTQISFRAMLPDDLAQAWQLSKDLAWPHRLEDWEQMFSLGNGFVATTSENTVIGTILWWAWGPQAASLGMIIVSPAWQGHGIGRQLMTLARQALPGYRVHLNATSVGVPLYEKTGFHSTCVVAQHQGNVSTVPLIPLPEGCRMRPMGSADLSAICAMDTAALRMNRSALIELLMNDGRGILVDSEKGILGFSFCRKFGWGQVAGPVIAQDPAFALPMLAYWAGTCAGQFLRVDIPQDETVAALLDQWGLLRVGSVVSMTTEPTEIISSQADAPSCFALCSQAFG